ncbi:mannose-6-phosphate isomerase, class I [Lacrimispora sp.]|uniref:mannose-6-phosphate isomerase, class I n=1 Tax=Lacrimispora sp. TaxID=2719234 RepID=UPI0029E225AD|nr:mannose-6-phosphate isomerase [Lacrimispora sp.]
MNEPLFLAPVFHEKLWGGQKLNTKFNLQSPFKKTGEAWLISAHKDGCCLIKNGLFANQRLDFVWEKYPQLFGYPKEEKFPLLVKLIDAQDDLSVQVHPDDAYAWEHEGESGKTECWYILEAEESAEIIYGHNAQTKEEFISRINNGEWETLLRKVPVAKGEFYYVPTGTVHAIGKGCLIIEVQQSSNSTYRLYDYNRKNKKGELRDIHLKQSLDVVKIPSVDYKTACEAQRDDGVISLVKGVYFNVDKVCVNGRVPVSRGESPYQLVVIMKGSGSLLIDSNRYDLNAGDSLIIPNTIMEWMAEGELEILIAVCKV